ncbi:MAG TPA: RagB/SusD family nutrient uptake outer membrane protein [Prolixibacteraceae bacterium]|nr:RagB/SusD family nutrient uptake outer membrane protein [Prolixibacteraceae bacterium]
MKKYSFILALSALIGLSSCGDDFLSVTPTASQEAGGEATEGAILSNLASCYQIMLFDSYANGNYNSVLLMSDLRSDDIYKGGGDAGDQGSLYRLSQLDATATELPAGLWNIFYKGISRCNNVILACDNATGVSEANLNQYKAEAHFLRAYYTHWLWKFWGNIPFFEESLPAPYMATQLSADEIYTKIIADVDFAIEGDKLPMRTTAANDGRITKAAAMMLKARVVMYQKDQTKYAAVLSDMAGIINSGKFDLVADFPSIWLNAGEFGIESILESNQLPEGKTWGESNQGYGTNLPAFISPNGLTGQEPFIGGWGFAPVRTEAYSIFEDGDTRREGSINKFEDGTYSVRFQNTGLFMAKYAARKGYNPPPGDVDLNYDNNVRIFRYAEVLLNAAELMVMDGVAPVDGVTAKSCLDAVRLRAGVEAIPATAANIKLERRREFLGEGMRFWDLVRWGDTSLLTENKPAFSSVRTWDDHCKYLPIPQAEIEKTEGEFKLQQNPGY